MHTTTSRITVTTASGSRYQVDFTAADSLAGTLTCIGGQWDGHVEHEVYPDPAFIAEPWVLLDNSFRQVLRTSPVVHIEKITREVIRPSATIPANVVLSDN
jgi:hypothetical protein